ncbi:glycosyltransferase family 2 protein [Siphonobacter sp. SORGH_AS_0500]|uniref:glycosyltransferase family 2 protein n=1 Tax=Siphonobacter sp. SORGH_AS_0500 TaxID=1864824 RepID=UPI00285B417C|nr:glycosyltransferase family 2 protein [Siphonobacter sp. SORGH_AS_0500]MDR6194875.1 GT2 family glycosyltransferase [Siphonobacter sp. SORGH_AS_0500]
MYDVSILIINYKCAGLTNDAIQSVKDWTRKVTYEIIVVDNDSQDSSQTEVLQKHPDVQWINMGYNAGFARANNRAIQAATGRYYLLLNADTLQNMPAIDLCVERMDAEPDVVATAPMQLYANGTPQPYFQSFAEFRRIFYIVPIRLQTWLERLIPETKYQDPRQHDWLVGAFMVVRREAVAKVGPLDESFFMYGEDVEWSYRLGKAGKLLYFKDLGFLHLTSDSPFRRTDVSYVNRFNVQMQVSNLLWLRKQYGVGAYLVVMLNYALLIPIFTGWKAFVNFRNRRPIFSEMENQKRFSRRFQMLLRYFWPTVWNRPGFYKIKPEENIV